MTNERAIIAIPMGDAAGVGPEITIKSLAKKEIYDVCKPLVIGDSAILNKAISIVGAELQINEIHSPAEGKYVFTIINRIKSSLLN